jgi:hypothetical protein
MIFIKITIIYPQDMGNTRKNLDVMPSQKSPMILSGSLPDAYFPSTNDIPARARGAVATPRLSPRKSRFSQINRKTLRYSRLKKPRNKPSASLPV